MDQSRGAGCFLQDVADKGADSASGQAASRLVCMSDDDLPPPADRRPARRNRMLLTGLLVYDQGSHSLRCSIRDLSDSGARVAFAKGQMLPRLVWLINVRSRTAHAAETIWATEGAAGLRFTDAVDLNGEVVKDLAYLKRILVAVSP
jgi:hypothetical protein